MAAMELMSLGAEVDLSTGVFGTETEAPGRLWQIQGGIEYRPDAGHQIVTFNVSRSAEGASQFPLAALAPVLITGAAKWPEGKTSPFDAAVAGLEAGDAAEITRRLDFLFGDDFNAVAHALLCKSTVGRSKRGDSIEISTDISVPSKSARQSVALSAEEVAMFVSVNKVHDFTETLVHTVTGDQHRLEGDAFLLFETEDGRRIKAKLTTTWTPRDVKNEEKQDGVTVYQIQREIAHEFGDFGQNVVTSKGEAELVYSSSD